MAPAAVRCCLAVVRWLPVIFITAVVVWSYYAYVVIMCILTADTIIEKVIYLLLYHPILFMFGWAYYKTIFTEPGSVPKQFYLGVNDVTRFETADSEDQQRQILDNFARNLPIQCRTNSGAVRYCEKCKCVKPDRGHHCSVCSRCVLKMDHHCPWVNNCVCFTTYKFFILFLVYGLIYCLYVALTSLKYFIQFWTNIGNAKGGGGMEKFHILFLFFAAVMFAISLVSLFGYHCFLVSVNRSTLESFRAPIFRSGPDKDGFSLGRSINFQEVFGDDKSKWFLPFFTSRGDGVTYPTRVPQPAPNYNTMDSTPTNPSMGDGVNFPVRTIDEDFDSLLGQRQRWMEEGEADNMTAAGYENKGLDSGRT